MATIENHGRRSLLSLLLLVRKRVSAHRHPHRLGPQVITPAIDAL